MKPVKGYFSIIQYCPDLARRETVNIGVLLMVPEQRFLQARLVRDNERVRHFFGTRGEDLRALRLFKKSFASRVEAEGARIQTAESLQKFIDTRGNHIQLTNPGFVKVRRCEATLDALFESLVGGMAKKGRREPFVKKLHDHFESAGIFDRIYTDIPIEVPILKHETKVPFGFQNGSFHLLRPVSFKPDKEESNFRIACRYSTAGKLYQEHPDKRFGQLEFNVIGRFASESDTSIPIVRKVLAESNVRLHLEHDLSSLVDEIRITGKVREEQGKSSP